MFGYMTELDTVHEASSLVIEVEGMLACVSKVIHLLISNANGTS